MQKYTWVSRPCLKSAYFFKHVVGKKHTILNEKYSFIFVLYYFDWARLARLVTFCCILHLCWSNFLFTWKVFHGLSCSYLDLYAILFLYVLDYLLACALHYLVFPWTLWMANFVCCVSSTPVHGCQIWHPNLVRLAPNGTNMGLFKISFSTFCSQMYWNWS